MVQLNLLKEEATPHVEFQDEEDFRNYLLYVLLKGHSRYVNELKNYYVQFVDPETEPEWTGTTAAVDAQGKTVFLNIAEVKRLNDPNLSQDQRDFAADNLSMLIRHELLHSILKHQERTVVYIAMAKGYDPKNMSQEQFEEVLAIRNQPSILYRRYNAGKGIPNSNGAGDLELSKYYLDRDVELSDAIGGLVLDDHPDWINYSFEELMSALRNEQKELYRRIYTRKIGKVDKTALNKGAAGFTMKKEQPSAFASAKSIDIKDTNGARLLNIREYEQLDASIQRGLQMAWLGGGFQDPTHAFIAYPGSSQSFELGDGGPAVSGIYPMEVNQEGKCFAVVDVPNLDLYEGAEEGRTFLCFGKQMLVLPYKRGLLYPQNLGDTIYNTLNSANHYPNSYRHSVIAEELNDWYNDQLDKYDKKGVVRRR